MSDTAPTLIRPESAQTPDTPLGQAGVALGDLENAAKYPSIQSAEKALEGITTIVNNPGILAAARDIPNIIQETKPGYKSTEFYASVAAVIADLGLEVSTKEKLLLSGIVAVYTIARGLAKNGVANITPVPEVNDGP